MSKSMGKGGIRSKEADELLGLDEPEMGAVAYPEFVQSASAPAPEVEPEPAFVG